MAESCAALGEFAKGLLKWRRWVLGFWTVATLVAAIGAIQFLGVTTLDFDPPSGSLADLANQHFNQVFPGIAENSQYVAVLQAVQAGSGEPARVVDVPNMMNFSFELQSALNSSGRLTSFISNTTLWYNMGVVAPASLSAKGGSAALVTWSTADIPTSKPALNFGSDVQKKFDDLVNKWFPYLNSDLGAAHAQRVSAGAVLSFAGMASLPTLCNVGVEDSEQSLAEMDAIALPIAAMVLWYVVGSGRLLLLPLATISVSAAVSFGVMYVVGTITIVEMTTPSLMMSLLIAMSIDYSLFLLTRFKEMVPLEWQKRKEATLEEIATQALIPVLQTAGFTVLLSGLTLTAAFLTIAFFPVQIISSLGVGCSISLFLTLLVHLTLHPCLIATFPAFFGACASSQRLGARVARRIGVARSPTRAGEDAAEFDGGVSPDALCGIEDGQKRPQAIWTWIARTTTTFPYNLLLVVAVLAGTAGVGWPVFHFRVSDNLLMSVPRGTEDYKAYQNLIADFGMGAVAPYKLLIEPKDGQSVLTQQNWNNVQLALNELANAPQLASVGQPSGNDPVTGTNASDFTFFNFQAGANVTYTVLVCLSLPAPLQKVPPCSQVLYAINTFTTPDRSAAYGLITPRFDPFGNLGQNWLSNARDLIDEIGPKYNLHFTLTGLAADALDIITKVYQAFPLMIALTLSIALILLGISFKSIFVPLRSVFSICLTLLFVFGLAVRTYQGGLMDFTRVAGVSGSFDAQNWMIPVIAFSIVVGICLDYDIFLLSRTTEFRENGLEAIEAIRQGLCATGGIITAAGIVMAIAFGGLLFSSILVVNGLAFYMVVAVLYDTFIIRCILTPALMSFLGRMNWWPNKLSESRGQGLLNESADQSTRA